MIIEHKKRIAFLGGAFDPPHPGHEMLARRVLEANLSDLVLWVPSWAPPHKAAGNMADYFHRLAMARLAAGGISGCEVSDIEGRKQFAPSYSYKILAALAEENPNCQLQLLIGQDSLEQLHTWYCAREIAKEFEILVLPRKHNDDCSTNIRLPEEFWGREMTEKLQKSIIPGDYVEISSTNLRKELAKAANVSHIINSEVLRYIEEHGLYR